MDQFQHIYSAARINDFIHKYSTQIAPSFNISQVKCGIITLDELHIAATLLKNGELVAFPTETVYGLGANAFIENSVKSIFKTKNRPLSDPVIVHLHDRSKVQQYTDEQGAQWQHLGELFWPGPFTMVLKANKKALPTADLLSAETGNVGFRVPSEKVTLRLLELAGVPVAAPSANLFAHISPTSAVHVFNDFYNQRVHIIDGERCTNGIESTVVKVIDGSLEILRLGSLAEKELQLKVDSDCCLQGLKINYLQKIYEISENEELPPLPAVKKKKSSLEAPGQLLKHYSPNIETFQLKVQPTCQSKPITLENDVVVLDFHGELRDLFPSKTVCRLSLDYQVYSLSHDGDAREAMHNLYDLLRFAENVHNAKTILIHDLSDVKQMNNPEHLQTLKDKIYRSASGRYVIMSQNHFYESL